jgi:hypothetical protein
MNLCLLYRGKNLVTVTSFVRILDAIISQDIYFVQQRNAARKLGHFSLQKMTTAIMMLVYGVTTDFIDEYLRIGEMTTMNSFI